MPTHAFAVGIAYSPEKVPLLALLRVVDPVVRPGRGRRVGRVGQKNTCTSRRLLDSTRRWVLSIFYVALL